MKMLSRVTPAAVVGELAIRRREKRKNNQKYLMFGRLFGQIM